MSYFSLLRPAAPGDGSYTVEQFHINVWSLPGLFGHRPMIIDVGVLFTPAPGPKVKALEMVLPARVVKQIDLSKELLDSENARLIFGRHYEASGQRTLQLKDLGSVPVIAADTIEEESELQRLTHEAATELTALRVGLADIDHEGACYSRVRFVVDRSGALWRWNRVLGRRNGATIDLRVPDPREGGAGALAPAAILERDLPIAHLEAFFILPERFHVSGQTPQLRYTRTLEGDRWRDYLRRGAAGRLRRETLLVHRWSQRSDEDRPAVSSDRPFRGYLQFERVPSFRAPSDLLLVGIVVTGLAYAVFTHANLRSGIVDAGNWIGSAATAVYALIAGLSVLAILALVARLKKVRVKRMFKVVEHKWFNLLGR